MMGIPIWYPQWWMNLGLMKEEHLFFHQSMTISCLILLLIVLVTTLFVTGAETRTKTRIENGRGVLVIVLLIGLLTIFGFFPIFEVLAAVGAVWFTIWLLSEISKQLLAAFGRVD